MAIYELKKWYKNSRLVIGAHFTSEIDIQKIVFPTIVKPFREKIENAKSEKTAKAFKSLLKELHDFKVLDPACGSGNFLYVAFRELRRLEVEVIELLSEQTGSKQTSLAMVSPKNFFGIDKNGFGLELAKVALCIGRKLSADEFKVQDNVLPFENLDENFIHGDALFSVWPESDAIIGNPPFLGSRKMRESGFSDEYIKKMWSLFPSKDFPKSADLCCYWFRKAHLQSAKYIGLVGTNSIAQNESRRASLDFVEQNNGTIHYAISTQVWSGDAKVHVSIVNWVKGNWDGVKILDGREVEFISSSLRSVFDVTKAHKLEVNKGKCFQGVVPVGKFGIDKKTMESLVKTNHVNRDVIKVYITGEELTEFVENKEPKYIIDFDDKTIEQASFYKEPFKHILEKVKPTRDKVRREVTKLNWWQFGEKRPAFRNSIKKIKRFIAVPRVSKWTIPLFQNSLNLLGDAAWGVASDDFYVLGMMSSNLHRNWVIAQSSSLKGDTRYTNTTCFETFPFLWDLSEKKKDKIRDIMKRLDEYRFQVMKQNKYGITKLYNQFYAETTSQLHQLHQELNESCCDLYGWKYDPTKNYNEQLFKLNLEMCKKQAGHQGILVNESSSEDISVKTRKKPKKNAK